MEQYNLHREIEILNRKLFSLIKYRYINIWNVLLFVISLSPLRPIEIVHGILMICLSSVI